jgi:hypothetical protein
MFQQATFADFMLAGIFVLLYMLGSLVGTIADMLKKQGKKEGWLP